MDRHEWTDTETGTGYFATAESISAPERPGLEGWRRAAAAGREILRLAAWVKEADSTIQRLKGYLSDTEAARLAALADNRSLQAEVAKWKAACREEIAKLMPCQEENERLGWRVKELEAKLLSLGRERAALNNRVSELENYIRLRDADADDRLRRRAEGAEQQLAAERDARDMIVEGAVRPWRDEVRSLKAELEKADMLAAEKAGGAAIFFERWKGASQEIEGLQKRIDTLEYQLGNARDENKTIHAAYGDLNHQLAVADRRVAVAQGRAKELDGLATQRRYRIEELELTVAAHQKAHRDDASALNDLWRRIEALEKERDVTRARLEEPVTYGCIAEELLDAFPALLTALSQRLDQGSEPALLARCRYLLQRFQDMAELQSRAEREG